MVALSQSLGMGFALGHGGEEERRGGPLSGETRKWVVREFSSIVDDQQEMRRQVAYVCHYVRE